MVLDLSLQEVMCFWNFNLRGILERQCIIAQVWSRRYLLDPCLDSGSSAWLLRLEGRINLKRWLLCCSRCSFSYWIIALLWDAQLFILRIRRTMSLCAFRYVLYIKVYVYIIISNLRIFFKQLLPLLSVLSHLVGPGAWTQNVIRLGGNVFTHWAISSMLY